MVELIGPFSVQLSCSVLVFGAFFVLLYFVILCIFGVVGCCSFYFLLGLPTRRVVASQKRERK